MYVTLKLIYINIFITFVHFVLFLRIGYVGESWFVHTTPRLLSN